MCLATRVMHTFWKTSFSLSVCFVLFSDICDLHLKVAPDGLSGKPLEDEGFSYLLAGAKATWGVTKGKVCFECKVTSFVSVELPEAEDPKNVARIGWSTDAASLQLGEFLKHHGLFFFFYYR